MVERVWLASRPLEGLANGYTANWEGAHMV